MCCCWPRLSVIPPSSTDPTPSIRIVGRCGTWDLVGGTHYRLGAPLARLEAGMALSAITARFPYARLDSEPQCKANVGLRGLSELTVAV